MGHAFGMLLAYSLLPTLVIYAICALVTKGLRLTNATVAVGFFIAWGATAVVALMLATEPTADSAAQSVIPAAIAGSILAIIAIATAGQRKPAGPEKREERDAE